MGSRAFFEPLETALGRLEQAEGGGGEMLTGLLYECYACETLEILPSELARWDWQRCEVALGWAEGRMIGEWTQQNPPQGQTPDG